MITKTIKLNQHYTLEECITKMEEIHNTISNHLIGKENDSFTTILENCLDKVNNEKYIDAASIYIGLLKQMNLLNLNIDHNKIIISLEILDA